jgi:predicted transcriptional regulator of viral defense system
VPRARGIGGGNRADDMVTSGGLYDQVRITSATSGVNGQIDKLTLSNLFSSGGGCVLDRIKVGTLEVILNETGAGNGFATKDFQIANTVVYKSFINEDNVEVSISPPT